MNHVVLEMHSASSLFKAQMRKVSRIPTGLVCVLLFLPFFFISASPHVQASAQRSAERATLQVATVPTSHADIALVIDNVNKINTFDPTGARFIAAQMFVDQAQPGSRIGVVRITSSDKPAPTLLLNLTTIRNSTDKSTVEQALTQDHFGPLDPGPTAYFIPAFQTASQMLLAAQDNNHKYIIVLTDSVALSGDPGPCPASPDLYHQWFCQIPVLEADKISVIFFCFTTPGGQTAPQATRRYLSQHGGMLLQVG